MLLIVYLQSTAADQEKEEVKGGDDPPEDAFLMVTQQHWEDKILWDTPYTPGPAYTVAGNKKDNYEQRPKHSDVCFIYQKITSLL